MKNPTKGLKYVLIIGASCVLLTPIHIEREYNNPKYEIIDDKDGAYAIMPTGKVFIGDEEFINSVDHNENDILIVDEREIDENIKILDSYKIKDKDVQNTILCIVKDYEKQYPTKWERSIESMRAEWLAHNAFYNLNYRISSTKDVDFENNEEKFYSKDMVKKIFK